MNNSASNQHPTVDVHAHVLIPALQQLVAEKDPQGFSDLQALEVKRNGPESMANSGRMIKERWPQLTDLERRLADMDAQGVDVQLVSPSPSHFYYFAGERLSLELAKQANEAVRSFVDRAPERLNGLGLVPLQHPQHMVEALEHAVLECGLLGVEIGSFAATPADPEHSTVELSDPRLEPFWSRAVELGAIVFLHPFGCSLDERLDRFYLANTVSQPAENAVALSHLIFSGVLDRHPDLKILAAHGGGYLPTTIGRSDHAWKVRPEAQRCAEPPSTYLQRIFFDSLVHSPRELRALVEVAGPAQVLLGSDYPFDMGAGDPVDEVHAAGLPTADAARVLAGNAAALGITASAALAARPTA
ncbi:amidohydrolase family protein [Paenarthrobacter nitroguajacolicus]|uniref:amidohydrolase family protein n=1 Tax=Paenarthrobacter nitroguajacolicus TaxID=211146 RepID=UPI002862A4EC|nr:amidohydrolase family protein [Paenarthrobacter nitroguajacolicus]MDR6636999.1 aminocarboxymuconate-semialdehyde decarboxylase [Paenarthrobacter nitroguajacolicus]